MTHPIAYRARTLGLMSVAIVALGTLAACGSPSQPPHEVRADQPRVTFNYRGEDERMHADRRADEFCSRYQSVGHTVRVSEESNGSVTAEYECVPAPAPVVVAPRPAPSMTYSFRNDQELLDASRSAQSQCAPSSSPMTSMVTTDGNGNRTVTFQCGRG